MMGYMLLFLVCLVAGVVIQWRDGRVLPRLFVIGSIALFIGAFMLYRTRQADDVSLAQLTPVASSQGWGVLKQNLSVDNHRLSIDGFVFRSGLGTHAPSRITYHLNGAYREFETLFGADAEISAGRRLQFRILVDDQLRFDSGILTAPHPLGYAAVDVTNARYLTLEVLDGGDGINNDHADWINPTLYRTRQLKSLSGQ